MGYYSCAGDMWAPRGQREGNITFFFLFFFLLIPHSPPPLPPPALPFFLISYDFSYSRAIPFSPPRLSGVHSIISHYFFVIMKARGFFSTVRFEDWESPTVERFTHGNEVWIRGFESFPRSGFPVNFPISRLGDHWWSVIFCSVHFFFFLFK